MKGLYSSIEEALDAVKILARNQIEYRDEKIKNLQIENEALRSEHFKDNEIKRLKQENNELRKDMLRGFPISAEEWQKLAAWQQYHIKNKHGGRQVAGAIGGRFSYEFTPTSIGTTGVCRCSCGDYYTFQEIN